MVGGIQLGDVGGAVNTVRSIMNPNLGIQTQLKAELVKNPELRQKLIDMEAENPGTVAKLFGKEAAGVGQGNPSDAAQQEIFNRSHANDSISAISGMQTGRSEKLMRDTTGMNSPMYNEQGSRATTAAAEATAAPDKAAYEKAKATVDLHLLPARAQEEAAQLADATKQRSLVTGLMKSYKGPAGVVNAMVNQDPNMPEEGRNAAFKDEGLYRQYQEVMVDKRLKLEAARDAAKDAKQKATIDDEIMRHDAQNKADLSAKYGNNSTAEDLFMIKKSHLEPVMDQVSQMNPQQLQAAAQQNPAIGQILQHPTLVQSWNAWKKTTQEIDDKDLATQKMNYMKSINNLRTDISAKKVAPSEVQNRILDLMQDPYYQMMKDKGTPLPTPAYNKDNNGLFAVGNKLKFMGADGKEMTDPTAAMPNQNNPIEKIAQAVVAGQYDTTAVFNDPNIAKLGPTAKQDILKRIAELKKAKGK